MHRGAARGSSAPGPQAVGGFGMRGGWGEQRHEATELVLRERQSREHLEGAVGTKCASELEQGEGDSVWAVYVMHPAALIAGAGSGIGVKRFARFLRSRYERVCAEPGTSAFGQKAPVATRP
jgi:hypothetical protein